MVGNASHKLLPGMVASVVLNGGQKTDSSVMTLPVTAVQQNTDGSHFVWTVKNGTATRTRITVGELTGNRITVADGISEGDKVIVEGYQKVSEGQKVKD